VPYPGNKLPVNSPRSWVPRIPAARDFGCMFASYSLRDFLSRIPINTCQDKRGSDQTPHTRNASTGLFNVKSRRAFIAPRMDLLIRLDDRWPVFEVLALCLFGIQALPEFTDMADILIISGQGLLPSW